MEKEQNTEQIILEVAEQEFLEKGYNGAKTISIAKRAGVNHAMIHYYFRTKSNLFDLVFENKIKLLASSVSASFNPQLSFFEQVERAIDVHFDFIRENPRIIFFLYGQIVSDEKRRATLVQTLQPRFKEVLMGLQTGLELEKKKGTVRDIKATELFMNIVSLNVTTFLAIPILKEASKTMKDLNINLEQRKKNIKEFIINGIKK